MALADCLEDPSREVRVAAALALGLCGTRQSAPSLLEALSDEDPLVSHAAAVALENLTGYAEPFDAFDRGEERELQAEDWRRWFSTHAGCPIVRP